jgi:hypothetical protein
MFDCLKVKNHLYATLEQSNSQTFKLAEQCIEAQGSDTAEARFYSKACPPKNPFSKGSSVSHDNIILTFLICIFPNFAAFKFQEQQGFLIYECKI